MLFWYNRSIGIPTLIIFRFDPPLAGRMRRHQGCPPDLREEVLRPYAPRLRA
jgi:hypothetical protein